MYYFIIHKLDKNRWGIYQIDGVIATRLQTWNNKPKRTEVASEVISWINKSDNWQLFIYQRIEDLVKDQLVEML